MTPFKSNLTSSDRVFERALVLVELGLSCGMTSRNLVAPCELVWLHVKRSSLVLLLLVWMFFIISALF